MDPCTVLYVNYVIASLAFSANTEFLFICCASKALASFSRFSFQPLLLSYTIQLTLPTLPLTIPHFQDVLLLSSNISPIILTSPISLPSRLLSDHSIYCTFVFSLYWYFSLCPSLSISFLAVCLCFMSISIFPSFISVRAQPLIPAATHGKKHIFCHIAMSVKFRSWVCVCMCLRFKGTFIIKFHFLCRQTLLPAGWQTRGNERANECVRACVGVSVYWLHRAGIRMHWLLFSFIFICLFSPPTAEERGVEDNIRIEFFYGLKLL